LSIERLLAIRLSIGPFRAQNKRGRVTENVLHLFATGLVNYPAQTEAMIYCCKPVAFSRELLLLFD
jgi:hypothetical protein